MTEIDRQRVADVRDLEAVGERGVSVQYTGLRPSSPARNHNWNLDATATTSLYTSSGRLVNANNLSACMLDPDLYETVLVIGDIIAAHCPNTVARSEFIRACLSADWHEAASMIDGMLVEPWRLKGRQETRLREFLNQLIELLSDPDVLKKSPLNRPLEAGAWVPDLPRTGDIQSDTLAASAGRPTARIPGRPGCSPRLGDPSFETPGENGGAWARLR